MGRNTQPSISSDFVIWMLKTCFGVDSLVDSTFLSSSFQILWNAILFSWHYSKRLLKYCLVYAWFVFDLKLVLLCRSSLKLNMMLLFYVYLAIRFEKPCYMWIYYTILQNRVTSSAFRDRYWLYLLCNVESVCLQLIINTPWDSYSLLVHK